MTTPRLTKYDKALNRLTRVSSEAMLRRGDDERDARRLSQALERVLDTHWEDHSSDCRWCAIYPPLFD